MRPQHLLILSCLAAAGCDFGTEGELGRGDFVYTCADGPDDPECASVGDEQGIPWAIAVGSEFSLRYQADSSLSCSVRPASHKHAVNGAGGFAVSLAGPTGFLATDFGDRVYDLIHVAAYPVATLALRCDDWMGLASACGPSIELEVGETATIEAEPIGATGDLLGGALPYAWESSDASIASPSQGSGRIVEIQALAPGEVQLAVTAGGVTAQIPVVVSGEVDTGDDTDTGTDTDTDTDTGADAGPDSGASQGGL